MKVAAFFLLLLPLTSACWSDANTPDIVLDHQTRCLKGESASCGALKLRAQSRKSRCDACKIEADKALCKDEGECWGNVEFQYVLLKNHCEIVPKAPNCKAPTEEIKKAVALCQMSAATCPPSN